MYERSLGRPQPASALRCQSRHSAFSPLLISCRVPIAVSAGSSAGSSGSSRSATAAPVRSPSGSTNCAACTRSVSRYCFFTASFGSAQSASQGNIAAAVWAWCRLFAASRQPENTLSRRCSASSRAASSSPSASSLSGSTAGSVRNRSAAAWTSFSSHQMSSSGPVWDRSWYNRPIPPSSLKKTPSPVSGRTHAPHCAQREHIRPIVSAFNGTSAVVMSRARSWAHVVAAWSLVFLPLAEWTVTGVPSNGPSGTSAVRAQSST